MTIRGNLRDVFHLLPTSEVHRIAHFDNYSDFGTLWRFDAILSRLRIQAVYFSTPLTPV